MALPDTKAGYEILLELERTSGSPLVYDFVCGIHTTEITFEAELIQNNVRDCASPAKAPQRVTKPGTRGASVSGSGVFAREFEDELWGVFNGGVNRNWRVKIVGGPMYSGSFTLTSLAFGGNAEDNSLMTCSLALTANGVPTRTASWS